MLFSFMNSFLPCRYLEETDRESFKTGSLVGRLLLCERMARLLLARQSPTYGATSRELRGTPFPEAIVAVTAAMKVSLLIGRGW